jgi:hypothetical protein
MMLYLHEALGLALGLVAVKWQPPAAYRKFPVFMGNFIVPLAVVAGSFLPDAPRVTEMSFRLLAGQKDLETNLSGVTRFFEENLHHVFLWMLLGVFVAMFALIDKRWFFSRVHYAIQSSIWLGVVLCHIFLDLISHGGPGEFHGSNYLSPFSYEFTARFSFFEYRNGASLVPKWPEMVGIIVLLAISALVIYSRVKHSTKSARKKLPTLAPVIVD